MEHGSLSEAVHCTYTTGALLVGCDGQRAHVAQRLLRKTIEVVVFQLTPASRDLLLQLAVCLVHLRVILQLNREIYMYCENSKAHMPTVVTNLRVDDRLEGRLDEVESQVVQLRHVLHQNSVVRLELVASVAQRLLRLQVPINVTLCKLLEHSNNAAAREVQLHYNN